MTPQDKSRKIVSFVLNQKCANGSDGLGMLNTHNQRNADIDNIKKCSEEVAMRMHEWDKKEFIDKALYSFCFSICIGFRETKKCLCDYSCAFYLQFKKEMEKL